MLCENNNFSMMYRLNKLKLSFCLESKMWICSMLIFRFLKLPCHIQKAHNIPLRVASSVLNAELICNYLMNYLMGDFLPILWTSKNRCNWGAVKSSIEPTLIRFVPFVKVLLLPDTFFLTKCGQEFYFSWFPEDIRNPLHNFWIPLPEL